MMAAMRTGSLLLVLVAACGGSAGDSTTTPQPEPAPVAAPTCADASANAVAEIAGAGLELTAEQRTQLDALFTRSCADDRWSPEAIRCVAESRGEDLESCEPLIPEATHARVGAEIEAILGAGQVEPVEPPPP